MIGRLLRPLLFWLALFELLARWRGWRGFSWLLGHNQPLQAGSLPTIIALLALTYTRAPLYALALAALPAFMLQSALSSLRNHTLDTLRRLAAGEHPDRTIERINIPMPEGFMPGLHIVPRGGASAAVCVLHGSGCDKTYYAWRMADTFVERGMAVLLVDLDGHGESPRLQSFPAVIEDAVVGVEWLREGYSRVGLVGVSLGGCIAARACAEGLVVDALALLETPPQLYYTRADMQSEALALSEPYLLDLLGESTVYHLAYTIYDLIQVQGGPRIRYTIGTVELIAALDLLGSLPQISAPLLMLYGTRDAIVKPSQAEQARQAAPSGAVFQMVPGASHLTLILHPKALQALGEWMGDQLRTENHPEGTRQRTKPPW